MRQQSEKISVSLKQFNINCVRTSHYPPVIRYLELADEYGIYIVDETGDESHATEYVSRNKGMGRNVSRKSPENGLARQESSLCSFLECRK